MNSKQSLSRNLKHDKATFIVKSRKIVKNKLNTLLKENYNNVLWPLVPNYLTINYRTLNIVFGNIQNFNFSSLFNFQNETDRAINSYFRN